VIHAFIMGLVMAQTALWQNVVPVDESCGTSGSAYCWIPPGTETARGVVLMGQLGIERELAHSDTFRQACGDSGVAIVYFEPHVSALFKYWAEDKERRGGC
jgi:hypothetical protein